MPFIGPLACAVSLSLLLIMAGRGLFVSLFEDDLMNLYWYWEQSPLQLVRWNLFVWEGHYRPLGAALYVPLFSIWGLNPLPYRLVCFGLLAGNIILAYSFAKRVLESAACAAVAVILFAYHPFFTDLYYSTATIYDLIGFSCFYATLTLYLRWRPAGRLKAGQLFLLAVLVFLGANAKELLIFVPVVLAALELSVLAKPERDWRAAWMLALTAALVVIPRILVGDKMAGNPAYTPNLSHAVPNAQHYLSLILLRPDGVRLGIVALFACLVLAMAWFSRSGRVRATALVAVLCPVPVLLIDPRSPYVLYIPYLALLVVMVSPLRALVKDRRLAVICLLAATVVVYRLGREWRPAADAWLDREASNVPRILAPLRAGRIAPGPGVRIYFSSDPFDVDNWVLVFAYRIWFRDTNRAVLRQKRKDQADLAADCVVSFEHWRLEVDPRTLRACDGNRARGTQP